MVISALLLSILHIILLCPSKAYSSVTINASTPYLIRSIVQSEGCIVATATPYKGEQYRTSLLPCDTEGDYALWQLEPTNNGTYFINNVGVGDSARLCSAKDSNNTLHIILDAGNDDTGNPRKYWSLNWFTENVAQLQSDAFPDYLVTCSDVGNDLRLLENTSSNAFTGWNLVASNTNSSNKEITTSLTPTASSTSAISSPIPTETTSGLDSESALGGADLPVANLDAGKIALIVISGICGLIFVVILWKKILFKLKRGAHDGLEDDQNPLNPEEQEMRECQPSPQMIDNSADGIPRCPRNPNLARPRIV